VDLAVQLATLVGFPLTIASALLAAVQATRSKTAAEKAQRAAEDATGRVLELRLQSQVALLGRLADHLDTARRSDNRELAEIAIKLWDTAAGEMIGALRRTNLLPRELHDLIVETREEGHVSREGLLDRRRSVTLATNPLRRLMSDAQGLAERLAASRMAVTERPEIARAMIGQSDE
jgi:hypothetical protein